MPAPQRTLRVKNPGFVLDIEPIVAWPGAAAPLFPDVGELVFAGRAKTLRGWPVELFHVRGDGIGLAMVYRFLEWAGPVRLAVLDPSRTDSIFAEVLDVLGTGRPDLHGPEAACLAELVSA